MTRLLAAVLVPVGLLTLGAAASPARAGASQASSDQARISQIEQQIIAQGAAAQQIADQSDAARARLAAARHVEAVDDTRLAADRSAVADALVQLRRVAVESYMSGTASSASSPELALFDSGSMTSLDPPPR